MILDDYIEDDAEDSFVPCVIPQVNRTVDFGDHFYPGTKEQYEADQKAKKEARDKALKQLMKDKIERPWLFEEDPMGDYYGDMGDALESSE